MRSATFNAFWDHYNKLPSDVKRQARAAYNLFLQNPNHPSLHFKQVGNTNPPIYSARVGRRYRVLGVLNPDDLITWYWIGIHAEYDRLWPSGD